MCANRKPDGVACTTGSQCRSGFCPPQDGVCCGESCDDTCRSCLAENTGAADGVCALVREGEDPDSECGDRGAMSCGANGTGCSGVTAACHLYSASTVCGPVQCASGVEQAQMCDGNGACEPRTTMCSPYLCAASGRCLDNCATGRDNDCASEFFCFGGTCIPPRTVGWSCDRDRQCLDFCSEQDGVCCNEPCDGLCQACTPLKTGGSNGRCLPVVRGLDPDAECSIGQVCDGAESCIDRLVSTDLIVRYFIDEQGQGAATGQLQDSAENSRQLAIVGAPELAYTEQAGNRALQWTSTSSVGRASTRIDGTKLRSALHGTMRATIELVADIGGVAVTGSKFAHIGLGDERGRFTLQSSNAPIMQFYMGDNQLVGAWNVGFPAAGRQVYHLVLDTTQADPASRVKLFVNGTLVAKALIGISPGKDATVDLGDGRFFTIGNSEDGMAALRGRIYYVALYGDSLSAAQVAQNAASLSNDDDGL